jgi:hypothetical protein
MNTKQAKENDFLSIEKSVMKYLEREINLLSMISSIEMFANVTFNNNETKTFYNFLMNSICDIEILYFMKGEEMPYHNEVISLIMEFQEKLKKYESDFVG